MKAVWGIAVALLFVVLNWSSFASAQHPNRAHGDPSCAWTLPLGPSVLTIDQLTKLARTVMNKLE